MAPPSSGLLVGVERGLATLTLNRPDKLNPLDRHTVRALLGAVADLERDGAVRAVVVTGAGKAFSAGGDLDGYLSLYRDRAAFGRFLQDFHDLNEAIEDSAKPYLAAVNGACVAGGLELAMACDLVLIAEDARIGCGHVNFGQVPGAGGTQRLPRIVGPLRARYLMLTGRLIDGREAERWGLATLAVPGGRLMEEAEALAREIAGHSPANLKGMKYLANRGLRGDLEAGLRLEMAYVKDYATGEPDATEGLEAFRDKRPPAWRTKAAE